MKKGLSSLVLIGIIVIAAIGIVMFSASKFQQTKPGEEIQRPQQTLPQNQTLGNPLINHNTYITFSSDGKNWNQGSLIRKSASVPDLIQLEKDVGKFKKGDLLVYFVDALTMSGPATERLGVISSSDLGKTWAEQGNIKLSSKKNKGAAVDPSVVQLEDGSLRLYFFGSEITNGDPVQQEGKHKVYSARSYDGINFTVEEGTRFEDDRLTDPEVIFFNGKWFMYYSVGPSSKLATSADGLNFAAVDITGGDVGGVPGALAIDGGVRLFGCEKGISTAISSDGINFRLEQTDVLPTQGMICDPAAVKLADGRYALIYKIIQGGAQQTQQQGFQPPPEEVSVKFTGAKYKTVSTKPTSGWFKTGQDADIMLSGIDFNNAGGPLLFNHPGTVASDGTHLLLADRNNNRVLIWNKLPTDNIPPDLVLGQKDFTSNNPGTGLDQMNWPVSVSTAGGKVVVTDTYNNRILIWNTFPARNGQPADLVINSAPGGLQVEKKRSVIWPWGVWTDGKKLAISSTLNGLVLLWNNFPIKNDQPADIYLTGGGDMGTPRTITSDGNHLIVGDHNAKVAIPIQQQGSFGGFGGSGIGNFFWKKWPTRDDEPYDFFMSDPYDPRGAWMQGTFTTDGKLILFGVKLHIWNSFPENDKDQPDLSLDKFAGGGDGSGATIVNGRLYLSLSNGNKIIGFNTVPSSTSAKPNFAVGSPDILTNTLETNFIMSNTVPATDGKSLFVSSDFDRKLYVYKNLPDESGAYPDFVYSLPDQPGDNELFGDTLVLAGKQSVFIWKSLPRNGEKPDLVLQNSIGNVAFRDIRGVALDEKYFYLSDGDANRIYVWEGIPSKNSNPKFTISTDQPWRLSSDGKYLVVTATLSGPGGSIKIYKISDLSSNSQPIATLGGPGKFNLPQGALVSQGHLFVGDTVFNRVLIWKTIEDAIADKNADVILGAESLTDTNPEIGRNKLFWPAIPAFDGSYLWIGEFKFSERLLRFSVH